MDVNVVNGYAFECTNLLSFVHSRCYLIPLIRGALEMYFQLVRITDSCTYRL